MINSFGTGKPTEADGSGRGTGKRTEAAAAVRLFGLFGCSGCSAVRAVRLFGLFGRRRLSSPAWPAASGSEAPTAAGDSSSNSRFQQLIFLRLSPIGGSGWSHPPTTAKSTDVLEVVLVVVLVVVLSAALLPRMASGER